MWYTENVEDFFVNAVKNLNEKRNNFTASITILRCKVTTFEVLILDQGYA